MPRSALSLSQITWQTTVAHQPTDDRSLACTTAELAFPGSRRRASAALAGRARPAGGLRPASAGDPADACGDARFRGDASGGSAQASGMVAIPPTVDPGEAEQTCPR